MNGVGLYIMTRRRYLQAKLDVLKCHIEAFNLEPITCIPQQRYLIIPKRRRLKIVFGVKVSMLTENAVDCNCGFEQGRVKQSSFRIW